MSELDVLVGNIVALGTDHPDDTPAPQNETEAKRQIKELFLELANESINLEHLERKIEEL